MINVVHFSFFSEGHDLFLVMLEGVFTSIFPIGFLAAVLVGYVGVDESQDRLDFGHRQAAVHHVGRAELDTEFSIRSRFALRRMIPIACVLGGRWLV